MKNYFFSVLFLILGTGLFSQSRKVVVPFRHSQLMAMNLLSELVTDLPADKSNFVYEVFGTMDGKKCNIHCRTPQLCSEIKTLLQKAAPNSTIYVIVSTADGKTKLKDITIRVTD